MHTLLIGLANYLIFVTTTWSTETYKLRNVFSVTVSDGGVLMGLTSDMKTQR